MQTVRIISRTQSSECYLIPVSALLTNYTMRCRWMAADVDMMTPSDRQPEHAPAHCCASEVIVAGVRAIRGEEQGTTGRAVDKCTANPSPDARCAQALWAFLLAALFHQHAGTCLIRGAWCACSHWKLYQLCSSAMHKDERCGHAASMTLTCSHAECVTRQPGD
jgi:hypothetical protein